MPETDLKTTIGDTLADASARLEEAGCDTPRLDAELLLAEALGAGRERLVVDAGVPLDDGARRKFDALLGRRIAREPVAYILGRKDFRRITLAVDPRVLIPRPETELLVEVGLSIGHGGRVLDVGTGSGAIALALKDERPDLHVWATDADSTALGVAGLNAARLGLDVRFMQADLLDGLEGEFDAVLANLPYVAVGSELAPEIDRYEPGAALFAGRDGLDVIRRLVATAGKVPLLALEVGFDQAAQVERLLRRAGFSSVEILRDLAGHERVLVGRR